MQLLLASVIVVVPGCQPGKESGGESSPPREAPHTAAKDMPRLTTVEDRAQERSSERGESKKVRNLLEDIGGEIRLLKQQVGDFSDQNWTAQVAAARNTVGYITMKLDRLDDAGVEAADFKSWMYELEATLRSTGENNWKQKSTAARHVLENLDLELATLKSDQSK